jgi:hypothetical protein
VEHLGNASKKPADCLAPEAAELVRLPDSVLGEKRYPAFFVGVIDVQAVAGLEFLDRLDVLELRGPLFQCQCAASTPLLRQSGCSQMKTMLREGLLH